MPPTIKLRKGVNERLKELLNCSTDTEIAKRIGVDQGQWSRVVRGRSSPGPSFQALLLTAAEGLTFYDLFEVTDSDGERKAGR